MMKDLLKKKMQHVINLHIHVGGKKEDDEIKKTTDLAPEVEDKQGKQGSQLEESTESYGEKLAEGDIDQSAVPSHMGQQGAHDMERMNILESMGAYDHAAKNPKGLRAKAMHAAGQELSKLKAKKKLIKS